MSACCRCSISIASAGAWHHSSISREVVQQSGLVDRLGVEIHPVHCEAECEVRSALRACQQPHQAVQRARIVGKLVLHRRLRAEIAEERADAHHHQRRSGGFGVCDATRRSMAGHVGQQLQAHHWVGADHRRQQVGVDLVFARAQFLDLLRRVTQHRNLGLTPPRCPATDIVCRAHRGCDANHGSDLRCVPQAGYRPRPLLT